MADRALLHKSKLDELKDWLTENKVPWFESNNPWQVIGIENTKTLRCEFIYDNCRTEHYTVTRPLVPLIRKFVDGEMLDV